MVWRNSETTIEFKQRKWPIETGTRKADESEDSLLRREEAWEVRERQEWGKTSLGGNGRGRETYSLWFGRQGRLYGSPSAFSASV